MRCKVKVAGLAVMAALGALSTPTVASASSVFGAGSIITNRNCTNPANQICTLGSRIFTQYGGGMSGGFSTSATNMNNLGASGSAAVEFGAEYLPVMHAATQAGPATRTGTSVAAFRSYTYTGNFAINLAMGGALDFLSSGDMLPGDGFGEGGLSATIAIVPVSVLSVYNANTTGQDIVSSQEIFTDCSTGAIGWAGYVTTGVTGPGSHSVALGLSQTCNGGAITINPGDSFAIITTMQSVSNRGGFSDASHTFRINYDLENTVFTDTGAAVGAAFLAQNIDATPVPEPATWTMMIGGLGLIGAGMRRHPARLSRFQANR